MKKTKILIVIIVSILLLICGIFAYLYFGTDIFKSNKEMFNRYLAQVELEDFVNLKEYENYANRVLSQNHTNEGEISITLEELNIDEKFEFTTKNNITKDMSSGKINFIQDGEEKLNVEFLKNEELYGIKCIYKQYLAIVNNNLKEFAKKIGIDEEEIPNKLELNTEEIKPDEIEKELKGIISKYTKLATSQVQDKNYSKLGKGNIEVQGKNIQADGYSVTLNGKEITNIIKVIVNNAKDDQELYNFVNKLMNLDNENMDFETYQNTLENVANQMDNLGEELPFKLTISVYKQGKNLVKFYIKLEETEEGNNSYLDFAIENNSTIKINYLQDVENNENSYIAQGKEEFSVIINKNKSNDTETFVVSLIQKTNEEEKINVNLTMSIGNSNLENVETNIILNVSSSDLNASVAFTNSTVFDENVEVQEFSEVDYVLLSDYSEEQINKIVTNLFEQISQKIDFDKTIIGNIINNYNSIFDAAQNAANRAQEAQQEEENMLAAADQQLISIFNSRLSGYEGEQRGTSVKALLNSIESSNGINYEHTIDVNYSIEDIDSSATYNVSFDYDEEGYINRVNID